MRKHRPKRYYRNSALTDSQKDEIREMANGKFTINQIADKVKSGYQNVYTFVVKEGLTVKFLVEGKAKNNIRENKSGFFNVKQERWMI